MSHVPWSVTVCRAYGRLGEAYKTADHRLWANWGGPKNQVLYGSLHWRHSANTTDRSARAMAGAAIIIRPILWLFVLFSVCAVKHLAHCSTVYTLWLLYSRRCRVRVWTWSTVHSERCIRQSVNYWPEMTIRQRGLLLLMLTRCHYKHHSSALCINEFSLFYRRAAASN